MNIREEEGSSGVHVRLVSDSKLWLTVKSLGELGLTQDQSKQSLWGGAQPSVFFFFLSSID